MHVQKNYLSFEHLVKQSSTQFVIADDLLHRHVPIPLTSDLDLKRTVRTIRKHSSRMPNTRFPMVRAS